jgi:hypothetical protein
MMGLAWMRRVRGPRGIPEASTSTHQHAAPDAMGRGAKTVALRASGPRYCGSCVCARTRGHRRDGERYPSDSPHPPLI